MNNMTRGGAAALAAALGLSLAAVPALADDLTPPEGSAPIVGMAYATGNGRLWLAGAKADSGVLVEADSGEEITFSGKPESVQALAWSENRLWVADIGDADASRDYVVVFRMSAESFGRQTYQAFDFEYEDGPHDAKAMLISGKGNIYVVTAGEDPGIYRPKREPSRERMNTLMRVADAPDGVTDGVFMRDGSTMALRTATGIQYVDAFTWETLVTETIVGAAEGESVAVDSDDRLFVGGNPTIRRTEVPASNTTTTIAPTASPTPTPTPGATASASPTGQASEPVDEPQQQDKGPARTGTLVALVLAGVVAVVAGAVTFFVRN